MNLPATTSKHIEEFRESLDESHPFHKLILEVFEEIGGKEFLAAWAEENPTRFIEIMLRLAPLPGALDGNDGDKGGGFRIVVNNGLQPGVLDRAQPPAGFTIDADED